MNVYIIKIELHTYIQCIKINDLYNHRNINENLYIYI